MLYARRKGKSTKEVYEALHRQPANTTLSLVYSHTLTLPCVYHSRSDAIGPPAVNSSTHLVRVTIRVRVGVRARVSP